MAMNSSHYGGASKATSIYKLRNYVLDNLTVKAGDNINKVGNPQIKLENTEITFDYLKGEKGDSAYKQALDAGFDGTEDEFKLALKNIKEQVVVDVEQIEDSEDIKVRENKLSITDEAKMKLFIDMWNDACGSYGTYNDETGYFELNGLTDITYEEAIDIILAGIPQLENINWFYRRNKKIRTNLPSISKSSIRISKYLFEGCSNIEIIYANYIVLSDMTFGYCTKLREIHGVIYCNSSVNNAFIGCNSLEYVSNVITPNFNINFQDCQFLKKELFEKIINNKTVNIQTTITVHPDVYAKLTGDITNEAAGNLSEEELEQWMSLVELAEEKNITFNTI